MSYNKNTNWANEEEYLNNLLKTGTSGEQSWAKTQLGVLAQDKAKYGNILTPNNTVTVADGGSGGNANTGANNVAGGGVSGGSKNLMSPIVDLNSQNEVAIAPDDGLAFYKPAGTYNDADLPPATLALINTYKQAYDDAIAKGDRAAAEEAHKLAEQVRAMFGYSGGADGSERIELTQTPITNSEYTPSSNSGLSANDILKWLENYTANNAQPTYESKYDPQIDALLDEILNREDFSYNVENDPLFAQYKTMYQREGDRAMRDTLAEVAASAGGMNSYAISAAQQANNYYNSQLNDKIPELYQLAYEMYLQDKESKIQDLGILTNMDDRQYSRYRDTMSDWWNDTSFAYGVFSDAVSQGNWEKTFDYNQFVDNRDYQFKDYWTNAEWTASEQASAKDEVWNLISLGVTPSADLIAKAGMSQTDIDLAVAAVKAGGTGGTGGTGNNGYTGGGSGGGSGSTGGSGGGDNTGYTGNTSGATGITEEIKTKCATFTNNNDLYDFIAGQVDAKAISLEDGEKLYAQYADVDEKYKTDEKGNPTKEYSYSDMIQSTQGWKVDENAAKGGKGGGNLFGIDANAVVIAPNGESMTLENLRKKLVAEGMKKSDATNLIQELQQKLGIANATLFGW